MINLVQDIHNSHLYGAIVEAGCGACITSELMSEAGASKTIYYSIIPYSKEYAEERYGNNYTRSVSVEFIKSCIDKESEAFKNPKVNFILAASWQLNDNDENKYVHGWIGIGLRNNVFHAFHFSFLRKEIKKLNREQILKRIGYQAIFVLNTLLKFNNSIDLINSCILDQAYLLEDNKLIIDYEILLNTQKNAIIDYPLVFNKNYSMRFEDLMRLNNQFIIQKGSFNPLHHKHTELMEKSLEIYPNAFSTFLISSKRYDKPDIEITELIDRIKEITNRNYSLIIMKSIYFYETFEIIKNLIFNDSDKKFKVVVGFDTLNRIGITDIDYCKELNIDLSEYVYSIIKEYKDNFKFLVFPRIGYELSPNVIPYNEIITLMKNYTDDGTNSTKIRNKEIENKI